MTTRHSAQKPTPRKVWTAGTLTYSLAGLCTLFSLLLLGDFAWSVKDRSIFQIIMLLFKENGASDTFNGLIVRSIPAALTVFIGPIIGYRSDRCRSRLGRRIPYLLGVTPLAVLAMAGLAFANPIAALIAPWLPGIRLNYLVLGVLSVFWIMLEFAMVIVVALFGALVNDVVPDELLGRFYGLFRLIGLAVGILFNYFLLGYAITHCVVIFLGVAALYAVLFSTMCFGVKEGRYPPPDEGNQRPGVLGALHEYCRMAFGKPYYLLLFLVVATDIPTMSAMACYGLFYARDLGVSMADFGKATAATYSISLILSYPLGYLADKIHPLRIAIGAHALYGLVCIAAWFTCDSANWFLFYFITLIAIAGIFITGTASLMLRLLPKENFATFSSAFGVISAFCNMLFVPLTGMILDWTEHQYRCIFLISIIGCIISVAVGLIFYREFKKHGGPDHYVAP